MNLSLSSSSFDKIINPYSEVLSFGLRVAELVLVRLLVVLLVDGLSLVHTVIYDAFKQARNQEKEIKAFSLGSNWK